MIRLRYFLHPVRSAKGLWWRIKTRIYNRYAEYRFSQFQRGVRSRCWCGGPLTPMKSQPSYGVCSVCGSYVNQRPLLPEELGRLYSYDVYWVMRQKLKGYPTIEDRAGLYRSDGRLAYWLGLVERFHPTPGHVLEVGGAPGILLHELQKRGYACLGVEGEEKVAAWMRQHMGIQVRSGLFPGLELRPCDLFLAFDVLEHSPDPGQFMVEVAKLLVPGGLAILQTTLELHDYENPFATRLDFFDDVEHLVLFTDVSMRELAKRSDLELVAIEDAVFALGGIAVFRKPSTPP